VQPMFPQHNLTSPILNLDWMQAAASAKPADRNPMGLSADALDASAWKSESRTASEHSSGCPDVIDNSHIAGVVSSLRARDIAPANFAWPVPKGESSVLFVTYVLISTPIITRNMMIVTCCSLLLPAKASLVYLATTAMPTPSTATTTTLGP
jgi:hypothetical protein